MKRSATATLVIAKATLGASLALGLLLSPHSHGTVYAAPVDTINLTDIPDIDSLPVCAEEDCSDQRSQTGMWLDKDTGDWYLERGEDYTRRVIDNTVSANAWDMGAYVGGYN
jgi:hypothetical protein